MSPSFVSDGRGGCEGRPAPPATLEAPATACEVDLAHIWCSVLQLPAVGRNQNFLALGGHSLHATQVLSRVRARWHLELTMQAMFDCPTLEALAAHIESRAVSHAVSRAGAPSHISNSLGNSIIADTAPRVPRGAALRTSYSQRRMWLVQQLNPQTTAYNMPFALRLRGPLAAGPLALSLGQVARRHEAFRTAFVCVDGEPSQVIGEHPNVPLAHVNLRHVPATQREAEARRVMRSIATQHFDLSVPGLHRTTLIQLTDTDHVLLWLIHHAIGDQWSAGVLMRELQQVYSALVNGQPVQLATPALDVADFAEWQRGDAHHAVLAAQLQFWRGQLQGVAPLVMPTDKPRRGPISGVGGSVQLGFGASRMAAVHRISVQHGVTPFMTMLACFNMMLARYSGQSDVAVGVPIANRRGLESEALVGTLVNTVVMRNSVANDLSFAALLAQVRHTALQAYAHQDLPFNTLVEALVPRRDRNHAPLVQVMFNVLNAPYTVGGFAQLATEPFLFDQGAAQFELSLTVDTETFGQIQLEYAADLFGEASAHRLLANYLELLDQLLANPDLTLQGCSMSGAAERAELQHWNATKVPFETGLRLGDLIRRQVALDGNATAVVFEGRRTSYSELDAAARALALRLRNLGAGPGALVGVCLERSAELVTALLGVVYSGAAYVPLDPSYPADRLARMCEDARMSLVVSRADEVGRVGASFPAALRVVMVRADTRSSNRFGVHSGVRPGTGADSRKPQPAAAFSLIGQADDPAYVIFTSGSTGRPKGAMNAHSGVVNWLQWMQAEYQLTPQDRVLLKTPYSFDVSLREFFWPLMTGATIVVARPDGHRDSSYLVELIHSERITLLHFVPSMLRIFLDEPGLEQCSSVHRVVCSGEALPADAAELFFQRMPHARLCNLYGPTEAAVEVTYWECQPGDTSATVPIGRPVANTQMHVLDGQMRPQPVGVPGELYIGGVQVGMGYVSRPELTAERFIPDPFNPGGRLYKTGDLARWQSNGVIDYLGRADDQVKIRGQRIELGEIEANLATHAGVARCVVVVREDTPGDKRLVAYVVPRGTMPALNVLRDHLRRQLPDYMVPAHCVELQAIPLLPNGKVNRAELPKPTDTAVVRDTAFWVPRTDAEVALALIWGQLLNIEQLSATDNFFDLGGHSLLAMRAVSEIHKTLGVRVSVRRLVFETLGQLASSLEPSSALAVPAPVVKARTRNYLVSGLQRMLLSRGVREPN